MKNGGHCVCIFSWSQCTKWYFHINAQTRQLHVPMIKWLKCCRNLVCAQQFRFAEKTPPCQFLSQILSLFFILATWLALSSQESALYPQTCIDYSERKELMHGNEFLIKGKVWCPVNKQMRTRKHHMHKFHWSVSHLVCWSVGSGSGILMGVCQPRRRNTDTLLVS